MIIQGIDTSKLGPMKQERYYPPMVKGRVAHIDADFIAYECSYKEDLSFETMCNNVQSSVESIQKQAGASSYRLHLTASGSTKGGRYEQAMLRQYQATRKSTKPVHLEDLRMFMRDELKAIYWTDQEADDGLAQANYNAIKFGNRGMSVICSRDKDLTMVPGLHFDFNNGEVEDYRENGALYLTKSKSGISKVTGEGWMFMAAQMLMGDTADNISGLPSIMGHPDFKDGTKCGPVAAYKLLGSIACPLEEWVHKSMHLVFELYKNYGSAFGFFNYRDGTPITYQQAFMSEAQLLWMRRTKNPLDVRTWLGEVL